QEDLKKEADALQPISKEGNLKITIDHFFDVKGVGTVILGKVTQGKVRVYDNLKLVPKGVDVVVKSIQMHDDSVEEASSPARVGLAVKGLVPDDVQRGDLLCMPDTVLISNEIELDYIPNKFFKEKIAENQTFLVNIDLQIKPAKLTSINPMRLSLGSRLGYKKGDSWVILKQKSASFRMLR